MTDQNGPRHGDDSVYDPNPDTAYDDDYAIDPAMGAAAAGGTAGAASGSAAGADGPDGDNGTGGPPLRGLAMVLTAVAVVLIAWGVYSFVGGDGDDTEDTAQDATTGQGSAAATAPQDSAAPEDDTDAARGDSASPSAGDGDETAGDPTEDGDGNPDAEAGAGNAGGGEPAAPDIDRGATAVTVLNNSGEPVAQTTADRLRGERWTNIGYGNLRGRIDGISEESRVYYPEGNAQSQAAAEQVAGDLGIAAAAGNPDYYDRFGEADVRNGPRADGVVVVLTGPL